MPSPAALIAIVAWANIAVAALWGWRDVLAYLPGVFHRAAGAGGILAVQFARAFVTIAAGLGSWERRRWARLWLLYASAWTLVVDAWAVPAEAPRLRPGRLTRPVLFAENGAGWTSA